MVGRVDEGADAHREIELKLAVVAAALPALRRMVPLAGLRPQVRLPRTTYFDTPDFDLAARGLALRVRRVGRHHIQTLKSGDVGGGGVRRRGEWEVAVRGPVCDLDAFGDMLPEGLLDGITADALVPVFATAFRRSRYLVSVGPEMGGPATVEVAVDRGEVTLSGTGGDGESIAEPVSEPISEVEFELVDGAPAALYGLAFALHDAAEFQIAPLAKSVRGYALAGAWRPSAEKAKRIRLDVEIDVDEGLAVIFDDCFRHWTANEAVVLAADGVGGGIDGVHQARVGLRRLRSAFSTFAGAVDPAAFGGLEAEAKWVVENLGDARDLDVLLATSLPPVEAARPDDPDLAALRAAAEAARAAAYVSAKAALRSPRYAAFVLRFGWWLERRGWREGATGEMVAQPLVTVADELLAKRHRRVLKHGRGFGDLPPEGRHRVRLAVKKLRYTVEFFRSLYRKRAVKPFLEDLVALQEELGHLNDVAVMEVRLAALAPAAADDAVRERLRVASALVIGWHAHAVAAHDAALVGNWERFAHDRPFWRRGGHKAK